MICQVIFNIFFAIFIKNIFRAKKVRAYAPTYRIICTAYRFYSDFGSGTDFCFGYYCNFRSYSGFDSDFYSGCSFFHLLTQLL